MRPNHSSPDAAADQDAVISFLSSAAAYGLKGQVERHQTHGAIVFLAGDKAYKLKRAVRFPYMDYSTPDLRHRMCLRELEANRQMAPEIYETVMPVCRLPSGEMKLGDVPGAEAIDWLVTMKRFEQSTLLENMRRAGTLTNDILRLIGQRIARFHATAAPNHQYGGHDGIASVVHENHSILSRSIGRPFAKADVEMLRDQASHRLQSLRGFLDQRREYGFVRRVHGDLHLNNICLIDGRPVPFDAIEFSEEFARIDTFYDLAFLLMDLDRHGLVGGANAVLNAYLETSKDYAGLATLPLFLSCRAAIRAHVTMAMADADAAKLTDAEREASGFLNRALDYFKAPACRLIAVGGVSGTGKSTLARSLAPVVGATPGAVILRSDVIRKELWGVEQTTPLPAAAYTPAFSERVFETILERAEIALRAGHSAIADAVYARQDEREAIGKIAARAGVVFTGLWLDAPIDTLEKRIEARKGDASDATQLVLHRQLENIDVPTQWSRIEAGTTPEEVFAQALRAVQPKGTA